MWVDVNIIDVANVLSCYSLSYCFDVTRNLIIVIECKIGAFLNRNNGC